MIFHSHRCIYIHVPKTGGTSIARSFGMSMDHLDCRMMNHAHDDMSSLPDYFRFATVRNPFDRFVSGWKYCGFTKRRSLMDVLTNLPARQSIIDTTNTESEDFAYHHITVTQKARLFDLSGKLAANFLVRYEDLQFDFNRVCDIIGKPRCVLPQENTTQHSSYQQYFDSNREARELAEKYFQGDLESFGYHY